MALQEDTQEGDAKAQPLAEAFQKEGLDAGFWLPKVSQILGIQCREALQHLEYEDYLKLECEVRHPWEKKALQKLLNITDDKTASEEQQKKHLEKTKQRQEVAKQALKDLTEMRNSHSHSKDALRKKAETLWQAMEIPKEFWPSPKETLVEMLESIHKQLEQQQELSAGRRDNIPDAEVLRRASGGLALQGIYRTSRDGDMRATREQLLRVPEGFQLAGPEQGSLLERREFSSSAEESTFTKSMEQLGFSMSLSAKFEFWRMNLGVDGDYNSSSQSQKTHQSHSEQSYFCTTKFQYIPLASCYFQKHQLRLSDAALQELQHMEQILGVTEKEDNPTFVKMCESFFSRFGSHINQGPLHFGGIFWWKASTEGFRAEQREEVKRQTCEALNGFVRASCGGFTSSGGGTLDVSRSTSKASVQGTATASSHTAIQLYVVNTGGPADAASLPQWKTGLVSDNTTWCVIDRGLELIPVWDVIQCNHSGDFKSVGQMSRALGDTYKVLTYQSIGSISGEELGSAAQEARDFNAILKGTEIEAEHQDYLNLQQQDTNSAEASLMLSMTPGSQKLFPEQKREHLVFMQDHMKGLWSTQIKNLLQKHSADGDWERLEQDLNSLISACLDDKCDEQMMQNILRDLKHTFVEPEPPSKCQCKSDSSQSKANEAIANQPFFQLFKHLGLERHYPRKMGMGDFHTICKMSLLDSQPSKDKELPFYFLQKLLTVDYRVRYLTCWDDNNPRLAHLPQTREQKDQHSDSFENFLDNLMGAVPECASRDGHVHPMDLQMAIFHCADDFLRQTLATKLAFCQLALPLLLPSPGTSHIEFLLYALSQIQRSWKETEKSGKQGQTKSYNNKLIFQAQTPIVSFIRIGSSASSSKSQLLNALLSKRKHDTFFHRHCRGSTRERLLMEGVVEIAWYCPRGSPDDTFETCVAFCNLHGDARDHGAQLQFLQDISAVNVALVSDSEEMDNRGKKLLKDLWQSQRPLICLLTEKENIAAGPCSKTITIGMRNRNEAELMDQLTKMIRNLLEGSNSCFSLDACADKARQHGFVVDADQPACVTAKAKAKELVDLLKKEKLSEIKSQLLPLQGKLWYQWCKKDKELTRLQEKGNKSIEHHRSQIENEKKAIRRKQLEQAFPLNPLIKSFLRFLQAQPADTKKYFLQWMKVFMDDLFCDRLEELRREYQRLWTEILPGKKNKKKPKVNAPLLSRMEAISDEINNSSVSLEHLLREVGQIYEAMEFMNCKEDNFTKLPEIAAEMMILGYPVELIDGDTCYLPLRWVGAIFDSLIKRLGDKRVFVLSVLGIQSTGKSTLLNAMFGLQFNVSVGRCTRGAFMQLIPVDEELQQDLGFDFVLVVDTEGLRAIEMANKQSLNHDNELATFVIGVGNLTLINIFGENSSEMQDVLQIAVQAFLRMKKVNLSPSCLFVHQNVEEATAKEQNMEGQRHLQEKLDEMTVLAAQQEFCDISSFSDVIGFDVKTHIHYFAHLWEGNPPMAPPNPTYSQNVQQLKSKILQAAKQQSQCSILKLSSLKDRIGDLWNALRKENFVFSFKNSLEIAAYRKLESAFTEWTWRLIHQVLDVQMRLNNKIQNRDLQNVTRENLEWLVQETSDAIENEVEKYFREDKDHVTLVQWKSSTVLRLKELKETLLHEIKKKCENLTELQKEQRKLDARKLEYEDELLRRSRELGVTLKGKSLSERERKDKFTFAWIQWIAEVSRAVRPPECAAIAIDIDTALLKRFETPCFYERIISFHKGRGFSLDVEKHIMNKNYLHFFLDNRSISNADVKHLQRITDNIIARVKANIEKEQEKLNYSRNFFHEILNEVQKGVNSVPRNAKWTFNRDYEKDLSLYLCRMAAERFVAMREEFQKENDPVVYLSSKREDFFQCFLISCQGATSITTFAGFLCDKIEPALRQAVFERTAKDIAEDMKSKFPDFRGNRANLEVCILRYLAEQENFEYFKQYLTSPKQFFQKYIERRVKSHCLDGSRKLRMFLNSSLNLLYRKILSAVSFSSQMVKDRKHRQDKISLWLDEFCRELAGVINLPRSELKGLEHQEVTDIEFLSSAMAGGLYDLRDRLIKELANADMSSFSRQPHTILAEHFSGCWEKCPFCGAVCSNTIQNHDGDHQLVFHRPQALTGFRCGTYLDPIMYNSPSLVIDTCSSLVQSDALFTIHDCPLTPYKTYRDAGPPVSNWNILPDSSTQAYWKWFVSRFRTELEVLYNGKFQGRGEIPEAWQRITKQEALSELEEY